MFKVLVKSHAIFASLINKISKRSRHIFSSDSFVECITRISDTEQLVAMSPVLGFSGSRTGPIFNRTTTRINPFLEQVIEQPNTIPTSVDTFDIIIVYQYKIEGDVICQERVTQTGVYTYEIYHRDRAYLEKLTNMLPYIRAPHTITKEYISLCPQIQFKQPTEFAPIDTHVTVNNSDYIGMTIPFGEPCSLYVTGNNLCCISTNCDTFFEACKLTTLDNRFAHSVFRGVISLAMDSESVNNVLTLTDVIIVENTSVGSAPFHPTRRDHLQEFVKRYASVFKTDANTTLSSVTITERIDHDFGLTQSNVIKRIAHKNFTFPIDSDYVNVYDWLPARSMRVSCLVKRLKSGAKCELYVAQGDGMIKLPETVTIPHKMLSDENCVVDGGIYDFKRDFTTDTWVFNSFNMIKSQTGLPTSYDYVTKVLTTDPARDRLLVAHTPTTLFRRDYDNIFTQYLRILVQNIIRNYLGSHKQVVICMTQGNISPYEKVDTSVPFTLIQGAQVHMTNSLVIKTLGYDPMTNNVFTNSTCITFKWMPQISRTPNTYESEYIWHDTMATAVNIPCGTITRPVQDLDATASITELDDIELMPETVKQFFTQLVFTITTI